MLNRDLVSPDRKEWTEAAIRLRADDLAKAIIEIWPVPDGHRSGFAQEKVRIRHNVDLSDLLSAGYLQPGLPLFPRRKKLAGSVATLLPDGRLDVGGTVYASPSEAAKAISGGTINGWWFFLVDQQSRRSIRDVRLDYLESLAIDSEEDDADDDSDDDT
jgi:hypothetical protein